MEDFLVYLDKQRSEYIFSNSISNKNFLLYFPLEAVDLHNKDTFICCKGVKTRILSCYKSIRVDLTDYEIIYMICKLDEEIRSKILIDLFKIYDKQYSDFKFKLNGIEFSGIGLDLTKYPDESVLLEADYEIQLQSFLFILNMIIYKDIIGQNYVLTTDKHELPLIDKTIIKYITLILYYGNDDKKAKEYLEKIGYPKCSLERLIRNKMSNKKLDRKFRKLEFDKFFKS